MTDSGDKVLMKMASKSILLKIQCKQAKSKEGREQIFPFMSNTFHQTRVLLKKNEERNGRAALTSTKNLCFTDKPNMLTNRKSV